MLRIASFNVENLFSRPKALNPNSWTLNEPILKAFADANKILAKKNYSKTDKQKIIDLFVMLDIYAKNNKGAVRRKQSTNPKWAWFRKNRGKFDKEPKDTSKDVEIIANGREDWIGWISLAKTPANEKAIKMTAQVIKDIKADIIGIVEAEDRPMLAKFNDELLGKLYSHVMLIDGNDSRGIDVGIMSKKGYDIESIKSNIDECDKTGIIFSRDCPQYKIKVGKNKYIHILVNHFKSQSGGGGSKRKRQADKVRKIVKELVAQKQHVIVLGDFNEGPAKKTGIPTNLKTLFNKTSPLVECYKLPGFELGETPGTYNTCSLSNRIDFILVSKSLKNKVTGGGIFRMGLWGQRKSRPDKWETYKSMKMSAHQASDHAAIYIDLNI